MLWKLRLPSNWSIQKCDPLIHAIAPSDGRSIITPASDVDGLAGGLPTPLRTPRPHRNSYTKMLPDVDGKFSIVALDLVDELFLLTIEFYLNERIARRVKYR
ncbi:hypothetical protein PF007_g30177 [Phytophthora fragariae]|uniref:Uncharacterized protein n=1 Tax=Phytophthora fragariae TaxID=53985 RepID=A0A6A3Q239_9STRA|nr:hypothetical protein PF007_g30177 [Phytophthora fragariae]KAE9066904.1 hypothetical protein PF006_g30110 [Phytophthora fragariae]